MKECNEFEAELKRLDELSESDKIPYEDFYSASQPDWEGMLNELPPLKSIYAESPVSTSKFPLRQPKYIGLEAIAKEEKEEKEEEPTTEEVFRNIRTPPPLPDSPPRVKLEPQSDDYDPDKWHNKRGGYDFTRLYKPMPQRMRDFQSGSEEKLCEGYYAVEVPNEETVFINFKIEGSAAPFKKIMLRNAEVRTSSKRLGRAYINSSSFYTIRVLPNTKMTVVIPLNARLVKYTFNGTHHRAEQVKTVVR